MRIAKHQLHVNTGIDKVAIVSTETNCGEPEDFIGILTCLTPGWFLPLCSGADLRLSYEQLLRHLQTPEASYDNSGPVVMMKPVMKSRPRIITWRDFPQHRRQEKSGLLEVPEPFTISTGITVTQKGERGARGGRRSGRSYSPGLNFRVK